MVKMVETGQKGKVKVKNCYYYYNKIIVIGHYYSVRTKTQQKQSCNCLFFYNL